MIRGLILVVGRINMKSCKHENCFSNEKVWSPLEEGKPATTKKLHYCIKCGLLKIKKGKKAKSLGYFQNCLAKLSGAIEKKKQSQNHQITNKIDIKRTGRE